MNPSAENAPCSEEPTPMMLAGLYVRIEGAEDLTIRHYQSAQTPLGPAPNDAVQPTADQLAGVYCQVEAPEDLTVHPPTMAANVPVP